MIALLLELSRPLLADIHRAAGDWEISLPESEQEKEAAVASAEIVFGWPHPAWLAGARNLRWLQMATAGVEKQAEALRNSKQPIILTSAVGAFAIPIAEHLFALLLALVRHLPFYLKDQGDKKWGKASMREELCGMTAGVAGYGAIGRAFAERARAFGMEIIAFKRRESDAEPGVDAVYGQEGLIKLLASSDVIVNCLPLTPATRSILDWQNLSLTKTGAYFLNVGRGATVDEPALVRCLQQGILAGAGLDVFSEEPLPASSPLWNMPNVIITPHVAGLTEYSLPRIVDIFCDNLQRYRVGLPLRNLVDPEVGY